MTNRLIAAGLALLLAAVPLGAEILEQVLVKVNGDIVTKTEFEQRQVSVLRSRPEFANTNPNSLELQRAIANAIFDATGVRIRRVPFRDARVLAALKAAQV